MVLLPLQEALGDEHRHHDVFMPGFFEHAVEQVADVFPDRGAVGAHDHAAAHARVIREVGLANDISIPFGKIDIHRGDVVHHLLFVVRHDFSSLISVIEPYYYNGFPEKMQEKAVFVSVADRCIRKISGGFTGSPGRRTVPPYDRIKSANRNAFPQASFSEHINRMTCNTG